MSLGITELIIILVIVLVLFGTTKLKSIGNDLGSAIKGFRTAVSEEKTADEGGSENAGIAETQETKDPG